MKKILLFIIAVMFCNASFSQVYKFRTTSLATKTKYGYSWGTWSAFTPTSILVTFDIDKERVTIYSAVKQVYDITKIYDKTTDYDNDETYAFDCIDADGLNCYIYWMKLKSQGGQLQVYVEYSDMKWVYNVDHMD